MAYCIKCGAKVEENIKDCPQCGAEIPGFENADRQSQSQNYTYSENSYHEDSQNKNSYNGNSYSGGNAQYFDPHEVHQNKAMGVLSYLGILVFIPVLAGNRSSEYVRFHSNQGLVLFIVTIICNLLSDNWVFGLHSFFNFGNWWFSWVFDLLRLVWFIFMIVGIVYACRGEKRELPVIGQLHILK